MTVDEERRKLQIEYAVLVSKIKIIEARLEKLSKRKLCEIQRLTR